MNTLNRFGQVNWHRIFPKGKPLGSHVVGWIYPVHLHTHTVIGCTICRRVHQKLSAREHYFILELPWDLHQGFGFKPLPTTNYVILLDNSPVSARCLKKYYASLIQSSLMLLSNHWWAVSWILSRCVPDLRGNLPITGWPAHESCVSCVRFSHDQASIFSLGADGKVSHFFLYTFYYIPDVKINLDSVNEESKMCLADSSQQYYYLNLVLKGVSDNLLMTRLVYSLRLIWLKIIRLGIVVQLNVALIMSVFCGRQIWQ